MADVSQAAKLFAEQRLDIDALRESQRRFREIIDALPMAIYTTDAEGRLTHFNPACIAFSGRTPELGTDHWCVTWKLYHPDGRPMPHHECPMALALKERRAIRGGVEAIAERPDGTRIWFEPYPTPLFDDAGNLVSAVNMLVDITERKKAEEARAQLAAIIESSDDAIVSKDLDGIIRTWNRGAERLFGYTADEVIGQPVTILMPPDRVEEEPGIMERIRRGERVEHYETVRRRKDGSLFDISITVSPVKDASGCTIGASKVARDISERRRAEQILRASEELYRQTLALMPAAVYTCDASGRITYFNQRAAELWGRTPEIGDLDERFCGSEQMILPDGTPLAHEDCPMAVALREGKAFRDVEVNIRRPDGSLVAVLVNIDPIRNGQGAITGGVNAFHDVSAIKAAEEELRKADRRKDEFLATLAHELRNPLAPLQNALTLLKLAADKVETFDKTREMMEQQLAQMVRLVDDLLDVSRINRGRIELRRTRVELAPIIRQAVEACRPLAERQNLRLDVGIPPQPIYLDADPVRLAQVFDNLLNNACKYSEPQGQVSVSAQLQAGCVVVTMKDSGIGIPSDKLESIFEMFGQVDGSLERSQGGLGIGLTLVKQLVELHGGAIEANSEGAGMGSQFTVQLPVLTEMPNVEMDHLPTESSDAVLARRVLVVDDNSDTARSLAMLLLLSGSETQTAQDGEEAIKKAEALRPDVILLDIGLPKINGYDVCRHIRNEVWGKDVLLVAVSGWGQEKDRCKSEEAGFDAHLVKPVDYAALIELLKTKKVPNAVSAPARR